MFWCFGPEEDEILALQPDIKLIPSALKGEVLSPDHQDHPNYLLIAVID